LDLILDGNHAALPLIQHLESHLGPIKEGWRRDENGLELPIQVALFDQSPSPNNVTFTTIGLSNFPLRMDDGRSVHQELVLSAHKEFEDWNVPAGLQRLAMHLIESGKAVVRGQCLGPLGKLFPRSDIDSLYVAIPVYFPDSFNAVVQPGHDPIVMAWLVPLLPSEAVWCRERGWSSLEEELSRQDPDLLNLQRPPMDLPHHVTGDRRG